MKAVLTPPVPGPASPRSESSRPDFSRGSRLFFPHARRSSGFALLITITLLAFLVLLLVSLASLTRVETQVASNNQQISQARQNALLALNIALGQLQKFTGPDQRTTARADMDATLANTTTANGRWIGAYGNGSEIDTNYALKASDIPAKIIAASDTKGSQAKLLNWLVSGNEGSAFNPLPAASDVGADGHITAPPASFAYTPNTTVNLAAAKTMPATADTQALLVGSKSATAISDYVAAPLVSINAAAGTIPGMTSGGPVGRYAWWVGDEGMKARANLPMASSAQASAAFTSAQRAGIEVIDGKNQVGSTNATDLIGTAAYNPSLTTLSGVFSVSQLSMLSTTAAAQLPAALRLRFHDLTTSSKSVMADVYAGGLKKDLSAALSTNAMDSTPLFPSETAASTDGLTVPKWGQLRSFAATTSPTNGSGLVPRLATPTTVGISPVLTYIAYGMQYTAPLGAADGNPIRCAVFPIVVLWNPYTVPLQAHRYSVGMNRRFYPLYQLQVEVSSGVWEERETINFGSGGIKYGTSTTQNYMRFVVDSPVIPPGASLIFTLQGAQSGKDYIAPASGAPTNVMTNGLNVNGHVLLNYGETFAPGEAVKNFRVNGDPLLPIAPSTVAPQPFGMSGGEACAFLGEENTPGTNGDVASYLRGGTTNYQWHQFIGHYTPGPDGNSNKGPNGRNAQLQTSAPLGPALQATSVMSAKKSFGTLLESAVYPDVRWIAQANPRAGIITSTPSTGGLNAPNQIGQGGRLTNWQNFYAIPPGVRANSGSSMDASSSSPIDTTLFEFRPANQPLFSLGQLQHANLSLFHAYPAYVVGNSIADYRFPGARNKVVIANAITSGIDNAPNDQLTAYYDMSWLVNRTLWDRYFVSTVPHTGTGTATDTNATAIPATLPNPRHERYTSAVDEALSQAARDTNLRDTDKAAANLLLTGGFNINSTSEQAWRAVLAGVNQLVYDPVNATGTGAALKSALSRFSKPTNAPGIDNTKAWAWQSYRQLSDAQIAELAKNIVTEIRNRGPFVSLADFVNRRLVDNPATTGVNANEQFKGVFQAAIDNTYTGASAANAGGATDYGAADTNPFYSRLSSGSQPPGFPNYGSGVAGTKFNGSAAYDPELMNGFAGAGAPGADSERSYASTSAFAPQFLTQADVLSTIGAGLSARSDTFTIRTYGETVNPVTQDINGRAWCEAVVQRMPDYVDAIADANAAAAPTAAINKSMGRRYKIISFRWLTSNDI